MNSPFAIIFEAVMQQIATTTPEIAYITQDFGQLEDYTNGRPSVDFPCALIDFQNWQFENMGNNTQRAEGDVVVRLAFARYTDTANITPQQWREAAMSDYEIEWKLNNALHGWSPDEEFGYLTRTTTLTENRPENVRIRTLRYRLAFEDYSAQPDKLTAPTPALVIST